ncbi:MAG: hypothetical protein C5B52_01065 [Bacteroidetes bacterium]|nr:MAG: hypothetical protein C5B52_01065 [Bacteroidota bacterium]
MQITLKIMLIVHIISGFAALGTGLFSMINRKGSKRHRLTGKIFFYGMTGVFNTAIFISVVKNIPFLFMVGFFSYYLACSGYRILFLKKLHANQTPGILDWMISVIGLLAGLAFIVFSFTWFLSRGMWGIVPLAFGTFCAYSGFVDLRSYFVRPTDKQFWLFKHGARMGGAFAATVTAFIVVNFKIGSLTWLLWILPGVIIGFVSAGILKKYRKKFKSNSNFALE